MEGNERRHVFRASDLVLPKDIELTPPGIGEKAGLIPPPAPASPGDYTGASALVSLNERLQERKRNAETWDAENPLPTEGTPPT